MVCRIMDLPNGARAIVCSRGERRLEPQRPQMQALRCEYRYADGVQCAKPATQHGATWHSCIRHAESFLESKRAEVGDGE